MRFDGDMLVYSIGKSKRWQVCPALEGKPHCHPLGICEPGCAASTSIYPQLLKLPNVTRLS
jgi:hypothetical protein